MESISALLIDQPSYESYLLVSITHKYGWENEFKLL